ncbi:MULTISPECIES: hypothetical protein [Aurantimonas]|uniref:hypothetical protein n=1 Tax=Aurantimonas TaxID=182269 RepID=UPI00351572D3
MKERPKLHTDRVRYVASVLFLSGYTERAIAEKMTKAGLGRFTKGKVSGILNRTPFRGLAQVQRQAWLAQLKTKRLDGGILEDFVFTATSRDGRGGR